MLNRSSCLPRDAVIAGLDLFELLEVRVEILRVEEGCPVDALQLLIVLVTEPVGTRDRRYLESLDAAGGGGRGGLGRSR